MKGLGKSPYLPAEWRDYIDQNLGLLLCITFVSSAIVMEFLHLCRINIFKFTVLMVHSPWRWLSPVTTW